MNWATSQVEGLIVSRRSHCSGTSASPGPLVPVTATAWTAANLTARRR